MNVINGGGKGGKIGDMIKIDANAQNLRNNDFFLDNVTGDLYSYHAQKVEWIPKMNAGLHNAKAAESFDSLGKYVIKTPAYKPKTSEDYTLSYISKDVEDICSIKKVYLQHWILQGLPFEFKVASKHSWHVHQFNFVNPNKTFIVMAESPRGPQIISFGSFCVASQFPVNKKYSTTIQLIKNFINAKIGELKSHVKEKIIVGIQTISEDIKNNVGGQNNPLEEDNLELVLAVDDKNSKKKKMHKPASIRILRNALVEGRPKSSLGYHSGFAITNHDGPPLLVENNTIRNDFIPVKVPDEHSKLIFKNSALIRPSSIERSNHSPFEERSKSGVRLIRPNTASRPDFRRPNFGSNFSRITQNENEHENNKQYISFIDKDSRNVSPLTRARQGQSILKGSRSEKVLVEKGKGEIMAMLYPELPKDITKDQELWVTLCYRIKTYSFIDSRKIIKCNKNSKFICKRE